MGLTLSADLSTASIIRLQSGASREPSPQARAVLPGYIAGLKLIADRLGGVRGNVLASDSPLELANIDQFSMEHFSLRCSSIAAGPRTSLRSRYWI